MMALRLARRCSSGSGFRPFLGELCGAHCGLPRGGCGGGSSAVAALLGEGRWPVQRGMASAAAGETYAS